MRVVDTDDRGGALLRMLLPREAVAAAGMGGGAEGACKGVGALMGVVDADNSGVGGPAAAVDVVPDAPSCEPPGACGKPESIGVGEANTLSPSVLSAGEVGGYSDILLTQVSGLTDCRQHRTGSWRCRAARHSLLYWERSSSSPPFSMVHVVVSVGSLLAAGVG